MADKLSSPRVRLGAALRDLRKEQRKTMAAVAEPLEWDRTKISRVEGGRLGVSTVDLDAWLNVLKVADLPTREALLELGRAGQGQTRWSRYTAHVGGPYSILAQGEEHASAERTFDVLLPPGIAQTEELARIIIAGDSHGERDDQVEKRLALRMERQRILFGRSGLELEIVLDEGVLLRRLGDPVMRRQLEHLVAIQARTGVELRIVPFTSRVHPGQVASFILLEFTDLPDLVYVEGKDRDELIPSKEIPGYARTIERLRAESRSDADSIALVRKAIAKHKSAA